MIPESRLETLLEQAGNWQKMKCVYHNSFNDELFEWRVTNFVTILIDNGFHREMVWRLVIQFSKLSVGAEQYRGLSYEIVENLKAI